MTDSRRQGENEVTGQLRGGGGVTSMEWGCQARGVGETLICQHA